MSSSETDEWGMTADDWLAVARGAGRQIIEAHDRRGEVGRQVAELYVTESREQDR